MVNYDSQCASFNDKGNTLENFHINDGFDNLMAGYMNPKSNRHGRMNFNAQSYVPSNYLKQDKIHINSNEFTINQNFDTTEQNLVKDTEKLHISRTDESTAKLKAELTLRDQIIKNLTDQLSAQNKSKRLNNATPSGGTSVGTSFKMPINYFELLQDMAKSLKEKTQELEETKERLEGLLVSIALRSDTTNDSSFTNYGHYDEQELAHKIVSKMTLLKKENDALLKMASYSNKGSLLIEVGMLRDINDSLRSKHPKSPDTPRP